jgi:hypothetical protein
MNEPVIDVLQKLRSEESALLALVERAKRNAGADESVLRAHRRQLGQIRSALEQKLPDAVWARETCLQALEELRPRMAATRRHLEEVREQARSGRLDPQSARTRAEHHQREFELMLAEISRRERDLKTIQGFLPGNLAGNPAGLPPVIARAALLRRPDAGMAGAAPPAAGLAPEVNQAVALAIADELDPLGATDDGAALEALEAPDDLDAAAAAPDPLLDVSRASYRVAAARDRRAHTRYPFVAPIKYRTGGLTFTARSADVSHGGIFVETQSPPPPGTEITVVFAAEGFPVEIAGRVVYQSPGVGVGVRFGKLHDDDRPYFEALLKRLAAGA